MKTAVCCIVKNENDYIREFVEWHKSIGFDNIIFYDNNFSDGEHIEDVIGDYIENGYVIVENVKDKQIMQIPSYNDCVEKYGMSYDWIAFFDCDEHLHLERDGNISDFLSNVDRDADSVVVNWMVMDDNDMLYNDGRKLEERFTRVSKYEYQLYDWVKENQHVKTILRCGNSNLSNVSFHNPHFADNIKKCVDADNVEFPLGTAFSEQIKHNVAYLKHFRGKTIYEYLHNRMIKGAPDVDFDFVVEHRNTVDFFFRFNDRTAEKEAIVRDFFENYKYKLDEAIKKNKC